MKYIFNISTKKLIDIAKKFSIQLKLDIENLKIYGITEKFIKEFNKLLKQIEEYPSDLQLLEEQKEASDNREKSREKLTEALKRLMFKLRIIILDDNRYKAEIGSTDLSSLKPEELIVKTEYILGITQKYHKELNEIGQIEEEINNISALKRAYSERHYEFLQKKENRKKSAEKRVELMNKLYKQIVLISMAGKSIWQNKDMQKYRQYLIYTVSKKRAKKTQLPNQENGSSVKE